MYTMEMNDLLLSYGLHAYNKLGVTVTIWISMGTYRSFISIL